MQETPMREFINEILKSRMSIYLLQKREHLEKTQENMAELLEMSLRGYSKLEYGEVRCGTETFLLILFLLTGDQTEFLNEIMAEFLRMYRESDIAVPCPELLML